jgi:hypothetical protein
LITCFIRYVIDSEKVADFEHYARVWMPLIEKYGGTHHGYFMPEDTPASAAFSFPGIGEEGPDNVAIALFSFPTIEAYDSYRERVAEDPECHAVTQHFNESKCFVKYERRFMRAVAR